MLEAGAVREVLVSLQDEKWGLAISLGGAGSRWLPIRSRTWAPIRLRLKRESGIAGILPPLNEEFPNRKLLTHSSRTLNRLAQVAGV